MHIVLYFGWSWAYALRHGPNFHEIDHLIYYLVHLQLGSEWWTTENSLSNART